MALKPLTGGKQPIRTKEAYLDGEYDGWGFVAQVNPPATVLQEFASGDLDRIGPALASVLREWNYVDPAGEPLALTKDNVCALPLDLYRGTIDAYQALISEATAIPKP